LTEDKDVAGQGTLQHDGHVASIEELDGVAATLTSEPVALDGNFDAETLEVNDNGKNDDGSNQIHDVGKTVTPERLSEGTALVVPGEEEMEESHDGTFKLGTSASVDSGG